MDRRVIKLSWERGRTVQSGFTVQQEVSLNVAMNLWDYEREKFL